jgi:hypothetical protein
VDGDEESIVVDCDAGRYAVAAAKRGDRRYLIKLLEEDYPQSEVTTVVIEILKGKYPRSKGKQQVMDGYLRDLTIALFVQRRRQMGRKPEDAKRDAMMVSPVKDKRGIERILGKWREVDLSMWTIGRFDEIWAADGWNVKRANKLLNAPMRHKSGFVSRESSAE